MKNTVILKTVAIVLLITLMISIILSNSSEHVDEIDELLKNTKIMKLYNYQTKELTLTYNEKETKEIIKKLEYNKWKESETLNGDEKYYMLKLYDNEDSDDIGSIIFYKSMEYVTVNKENKIENKVYKVNTDIKDLFNKNIAE